MPNVPNALALIALYGWAAVALLLFLRLDPRRAVIAGFLLGEMFLPQAAITNIPLLVCEKQAVTSLGLLLAAIIMAPRQLLSFRPRWIDVPAVLWCLAPLLSGPSNNQTYYDSLAMAANQTFYWGVPYFMGRAFLRDLRDARDLAMGILIGGLVYVPLCLYEMRMSPILHFQVYGFAQHLWAQTVRFGGYRPMVFMQHGLAVGMFMCTAALLGIWLWSTGVLGSPRIVWGASVAILLGTAVMCKSSGAVVLLVMGTAVLYLTRWTRWRWLAMALALVPPAYVVARTVGGWDGHEAVAATNTWIDKNRADSLMSRMDNETLLTRKAMERPWLGWFSGERMRVIDETGRLTGVTDGMWIIALGTNGVVGLTAFFGMLLVPAFALLRRAPMEYWGSAPFAPAACLAVIMELYAIDCLMNAMVNPIYFVAAGCLANLALLPGRRDASAPPDPPRPAVARTEAATP